MEKKNHASNVSELIQASPKRVWVPNVDGNCYSSYFSSELFNESIVTRELLACIGPSHEVVLFILLWYPILNIKHVLNSVTVSHPIMIHCGAK